MTRAVLVFAALVGTFGPRGGAAGADDPPGRAAHAPFVHTVIFYLKKDAPAGEADELIADAHDLLGKVPSVRGLRAGRPAEKPASANGKNDFQVGLLVLFDDAQGLREYIDHPKHQEYVARHKKYIDRIVAYDFQDEKK